MKFTLEDYRLTSVGTSYISEEDGKFIFHRFSKEQENLYKEREEETGLKFFKITQFTAGVKLRFKTNSEYLYLKSEMYNSENQYFSFDIFEDGKINGYLDNYSDKEIPPLYPRADFPQGIFEKKFQLKKGESEITICFPFNSEIKIHEISVEDGAYIMPVPQKQRKILCYGDSITQGYTALRPSKRYTAMLCDALDAEEINKAIGGEIFYPPLSRITDDIEPYLIIVAYGTNDWNACETKELFINNCLEFVKNITEAYPGVPIIAISPIWRADMDEPKKMGGIDIVENTIAGLSEKFDNVKFVYGRGLIPADSKYYGDERIHPNIEGFECYFNNLYKKVKEYGY